MIEQIYIRTHDSDDVTVIGPFADQIELDAFFDQAGRVFSSMVTVYSPAEWIAAHKKESMR